MSIEGFWNHTVRIYRRFSAEDARGTLGSTDKTAYAIGSAPEAPNAWADQSDGSEGSQANQGPGQQQSKLFRWYLDKNTPVQERDILSVTAGPYTGRLLLVESLTKATQRTSAIHHFEANCSDWKGTLSAGEYS